MLNDDDDVTSPKLGLTVSVETPCLKPTKIHIAVSTQYGSNQGRESIGSTTAT